MASAIILKAASRSYNICKSRVPASDFTSRAPVHDRILELVDDRELLLDIHRFDVGDSRRPAPQGQVPLVRARRSPKFGLGKFPAVLEVVLELHQSFT